VQRLKRLIETGYLGDVYYVYGTRHSWADEPLDVLWDVTADVLPVVLDLVGDEPFEVRAHGESYVREDTLDVVIAQLRFATGISAHFHVSALGPRSTARLTVVGSHRLAVIEDTRLTVHERIERGDGSTAVRSEAHEEPRVDGDDALHRECEYFLSAIRTPLELVSGRQGAATVHVLEALGRALASGGAESIRQAPRVALVTALSSRRQVP
jgi:predicted dehydrogenase